MNGASRSKTSKLTFLSLLAAAATGLVLLEAPLPRILPWTKIGLANSATLLVLMVYGLREAFWVITTRQILAGLLLGQLLAPAFWLGWSGACAAALVMAVVLRFRGDRFGLLAVSIAGALSNNVTQLAVAQALFVRHGALWWNLPLMLFTSIPAGALIAWLTLLAYDHLPERMLGSAPRD